jgi:hypothetical protein
VLKLNQSIPKGELCPYDKINSEKLYPASAELQRHFYQFLLLLKLTDMDGRMIEGVQNYYPSVYGFEPVMFSL